MDFFILFQLLCLITICIIKYHNIFALQQVKPKVVVAGATGYIGRSVVKELVSRHNIEVYSLVRNLDISNITRSYLRDSHLIQCDVSDETNTLEVFKKLNPFAVICCLASRSGVGRDAFAVDYQASLNVLKALNSTSSTIDMKKHFVLLSAYCCGKPKLQFQFAKLKLENEIINLFSNHISYSIVRPTAFFKSLDGQVESARLSRPVLYFGDGKTSANPISESDLANYLVECTLNPKKMNMINTMRDLGGPDSPPITKLQQIDLIYDAIGNIPVGNRKIISIPFQVLEILISIFESLEKMFNVLRLLKLSERFNDAAELARIVYYYAKEDMVAIGPGEVFGSIRLKDHFKMIASKGGKLDEIDEMTTTTGIINVFSKNDYVK